MHVSGTTGSCFFIQFFSQSDAASSTSSIISVPERTVPSGLSGVSLYPSERRNHVSCRLA